MALSEVVVDIHNSGESCSATMADMLFKEFCNHVYLGQWELARGCAITLVSSDKLGATSEEKLLLINTLKSIAAYPKEASSRLLQVSTPYHLSWLCCQLLQQLCEKEDEIEVLKRNAEFHVMLPDLFPGIPSEVSEELYRIHCKMINPRCFKDNTIKPLSERTCIFLREALLRSPVLTSCFLSKLMAFSSSGCFQNTNSEIQNIYLQCLIFCVKQVRSSSKPEQTFPEKNVSHFWDTTLLLLSLLPEECLSENYTKMEGTLSEVINEIIELCACDVFDLNRVYGALLGRSSTNLLKYFCDKEDHYYHRHTKHNDSSLKGADLPSSVINCAVNDNGCLDFREAVIQSLVRNTHFLEAIVNTAIDYLLKGGDEDAWNLLKDPLFVQLQPLILTFAWYNCSSDTSSSHVLQAIKNWELKGNNSDPIFIQVCEKLQYNIGITEWCIEKLRNLGLILEESETLSKTRIIFSQLQTQSPLRVIQKTVGLKNVSPEEVLDLLQCSLQKSGSSQQACSEEVSKKTLHNDISGNSVVFRGYLAIMHVMEAIYVCCELEQLIVKNNKWSTYFPQSLSQLDSNSEDTTLDNYKQLSPKDYVSHNGLQKAYTELVMKRLEATKKELVKILPLTFRLEILENIFSLLFVTHNDVQEAEFDPTDSDEGPEEEDKSFNTTLPESSTFVSYTEMLDKRNTIPTDSVAKNSGNRRDSFDMAMSVTPPSLKERYADVLGTDKRQSGLSSSRSTSSSCCGLFKIGFLCSELIVRDLLAVLKDSLLDTTAVMYETMRKSEMAIKNGEVGKDDCKPEIHHSDGAFMQSSANLSSLQQRISLLEKYVNEATWRFELVSSKKMSLVDKDGTLSDCFSNCTNEKKKIKYRRKHRRSIREGTFERIYQQEPGVIQRMLSSPEALLRYSLWRNNLKQADEVIQMFNLYNTPDAQEVTFAQDLCNLVKKMEELSKGPKKKMVVNAEPNSLNFKLEAKEKLYSSNYQVSVLTKAAADGISGINVLSTIDETLNKVVIPPIAEIEELQNHLNSNAFMEEVITELRMSYSIVLGDLAVIASPVQEDAQLLLGTALKCFPPVLDHFQSEMGRKKKPLSTIKGVFQTMQQMKLFFDGWKEFSQAFNSDSLVAATFSPCSTPSVPFFQILISFLGSLNHEIFSRQLLSVKKVFAKMEEMVGLQRESAKNSSSTSLLQHHTVLKDLEKAAINMFTSVIVQIKPDKNSYMNYLGCLYEHVKQLSEALLHNKSHTSQLGSFEFRNYSSVLNESPFAILSNVIQSGIPPEKVEEFASQLKVDLVLVLIQTIFPQIPLFYQPVLSEVEMYAVNTITKQGDKCLLLNSSKKPWPLPRDPVSVAEMLLEKILNIMTEVAKELDSKEIVTGELLLSLAKKTEILTWMEECSELVYVDLCQLKNNEEEVAFFANVTNIAWLHAILIEIRCFSLQNKRDHLSTNQDSNNAQTCRIPMLSSYLCERLMRQKHYGYYIGQLGVISLLDLRRSLSAHFPLPKHLASSPYYHLFSSPLPKEWSKFIHVVEPHLNFVFCEGFISSPKLQVLYPDKVRDQLESAMQEYLKLHIKADVDAGVAEFPQLLEWYEQDFCAHDDNDLTKAPFEGLLHFLVDNVKEPLSNDLRTLLVSDDMTNDTANIDCNGRKVLPFQLNFKPFCTQPGIILEYNDSIMNCVNHHKLYHQPVVPSQQVLQYLRKKCQLLADIYKIIKGKLDDGECYELDEAGTEETSDSSVSCFFETPSPLILLFTHHSKLWRNIDGMPGENKDQQWMEVALSTLFNNQFLWNVLDYSIQKEDWKTALEYIRLAMDEGTYESHEADDLLLLQDIICLHLASRTSVKSEQFPEFYNSALSINDVNGKMLCVHSYLCQWSGDYALKVLKIYLADEAVRKNKEFVEFLEKKMKSIILYQKIVKVCKEFSLRLEQEDIQPLLSWQEVAECSENNPLSLLNILKCCKHYQLVVEWAELHSVTQDCKVVVLQLHVIYLLRQNPIDATQAEKVLCKMKDITDNVSVFNNLLDQLTALESKIFLTRFIWQHLSLQPEDLKKYKELELGLKMLMLLPSEDRVFYESLVSQPHLLFEQLLMNMELDPAEKAIKCVTSVLADGNDDSVMTLNVHTINDRLEYYAAKALEFSIIEDVADSSTSSTTGCGMNERPSSAESFVMPDSVPSKEEWVPDAKVSVCQVCRVERFSMFCRRHHCRRCGRVVCTSCSQHRMLVPGYGIAQVRVCEECYVQSMMISAVSESGPLPLNLSSEELFKFQRSVSSTSLRGSPAHLAEYRKRCSTVGSIRDFPWQLCVEDPSKMMEEFYYEQAPSVSLCLSLLQLHSSPHKCGKYILSYCDKLFNMLQPCSSNTANLEVDYSLVINMMRSLLLSAKVKFSQAGDSTGIVHTDEYLRHLDLIKLLVTANCQHLIPFGGITSNKDVRILRDRLIEEERMTLALDLCTKYGLETTGVWATWGMNYLRNGEWNMAREKFSYCLKKPKDGGKAHHENPLLEEIIMHLETSIHAWKSKETLKDTVQSIMKGSYATQVMSKASQIDLKDWKKECLFYLNTYANQRTYLLFCQRHKMLAEALQFLLQKACDPHIFIEALFMPCVRSAMLFDLLKQMALSDPSLKQWWHHLMNTCHYLEKQRLFYVLYDLQLFMKDYIRAAMISIKFFLASPYSYQQLFQRLSHLRDAERHFKKYLEFHSKSGATKIGVDTARHKQIYMLPEEEVKKHLKTVKLQTEVTEFLYYCESEKSPLDSSNLSWVSGTPTTAWTSETSSLSSASETSSVVYVSEMSSEIGNRWEKKTTADSDPPTLFGNLSRKVKVAGLLLLNVMQVDKGFDLIDRLIQEYNLDDNEVLSLASKQLIYQKRSEEIPHLFQYVRCCKMKCQYDEVLTSCIQALTTKPGENKEVEFLIKMLDSDISRINAYILCGMLKTAYLLAVKCNRPTDIQRIMAAAEQTGKEAIRSICEKWLRTKEAKSNQKKSGTYMKEF